MKTYIIEGYACDIGKYTVEVEAETEEEAKDFAHGNYDFYKYTDVYEKE
tara:strand:- start:94 stop:240 length:147 start_codon:yes stop_codon:yes gene_type:complete